MLQKIAELEEREQRQGQQPDANSQLNNFAYVAAHDLREPLRAIGNFTQLLQRRLGPKLDETEMEFMGYIINGVKDMNRLIEDLLSYSRIDTQEHSLETINLADVFFVIKRQLAQQIKETGTQVIIENLPNTIFASKTKIIQLFMHLIGNAIKFRHVDRNPVVRINVRAEEEYWHFSIVDNGIGIPAEFQHKIFMVFQKLHSRQEYQGTGIGLALCERIVEQHGGAIWVESVVGEGSTFYFRLEK